MSFFGTRLRRHVFAGGLVASMAALVPLSASADSLRQAMVDAYEHSDLLDQNRYLLRLQDEGVAQAVAALRPVFSFVASTSRDLVNETSSTTASIIGEYVLYSGGSRTAALQAAREAVFGARQQLVSLEQQVLLDAVTAYIGVWRDAQVVDVRERNVRVITQQLRAARDRFEVGETTRTDVAQAEAQLAEARSALAAAHGAYEISRELFALAVGRYPNGLGGLGGLPGLPHTEEDAVALASQSHPSVLALQHEVTAADLAVDQARAAYRPTLTLDGRVTEAFESAIPGGTGTGASIGLTLTQPIYRGGQLYSFERQALAQAAAVRSSLNQQVRLNMQAVGTAWARMRIAHAQIQAAEQRIAAADLAFSGVQEEASLGARTTLDVLDAEQALLEARISRITAEGDLYSAAYSLLAATGQMTVTQLDLQIPEYDPDAYLGTFGGAPARVTSVQGERLDSVLERMGRD